MRSPACRTLRRIHVAVALSLTTATAANAQTSTAQPAQGTPKGNATAQAAASPNQVPTLKAARLSGTIHLDGKLDEPAWKEADVASNFTQSWPKPGEAPTERTEVRVLYGTDALYVGVRAFDSEPSKIAAPLARRDATGVYSDWIHLIIDSYHDRRNGCRFTVNPRGVLKDVQNSNDNQEDVNWDAVWQAATSIDSLGWTVEYRIPYSQLRFGAAPPGEPRTWGLQVMRDVARKNERTSWAPWVPNGQGFISRAGDLTGISDVRPPRRLEFSPYVRGQLTQTPPAFSASGDPFYEHNKAEPGAGADLKVGLPKGLTLTATINPDFGQVEVDPAVVNLTAFESFFPEKRPFFLEGAGNVFNFGAIQTGPSYNFQQFFYSRRIGRSPVGVLPDSAAYADIPPQTTIVGAGKVSGKAGPWTVGFLDALTAEEKADMQSGSGTNFEAPVEPRTNFLVTRLRRDLNGGKTIVGGMLSSVNRDLAGDIFDNVLRSRGQLGGLDFEHTWNHRRWLLNGYAVGSEIGGSRAVIRSAQRSSSRYFQRPDADYLDVDTTRTTLGGYMTELALIRNGDLFVSADFKQASPGFEINDLGFQGRVDYRAAAWGLGYGHYRRTPWFENWSWFLGNNNAWNFGNDVIWKSLFADVNVQLHSLWSLGLNGDYNPSAYSDRLTRGGPLALTASSWNFGGFVTTDNRKPIYFTVNPQWSGDDDGGSSLNLFVNATARPSSNIRISAGPSYSKGVNTRQYAGASTDATATGTYGVRYNFGELHQTTVSLDTRVDWTFTPTLSLQLYTQPFVATGNFTRFRSLRTAGTGDFDDQGAPSSPTGFNVRSLNGNAVVRWEYRPGSTLFFVWQQSRDCGAAVRPSPSCPGSQGVAPTSSSYEFQTGRDLGGIFHDQPRNIFLIKASYWLSR